ncbi:MAG: hypothetical protein WAV90_11080, partial [Gordonia amarae]
PKLVTPTANPAQPGIRPAHPTNKDQLCPVDRLPGLLAESGQIRDRGALRTDVDSDGESFSWVDETVMGKDFIEMYTKMTSLGYARGWL